MKRKKEEESGELVNGQRFSEEVASYNKFKATGIDANTFKEEKPAPKTKMKGLMTSLLEVNVATY